MHGGVGQVLPLGHHHLEQGYLLSRRLPLLGGLQLRRLQLQTHTNPARVASRINTSINPLLLLVASTGVEAWPPLKHRAKPKQPRVTPNLSTTPSAPRYVPSGCADRPVARVAGRALDDTDKPGY